MGLADRTPFFESQVNKQGFSAENTLMRETMSPKNQDVEARGELLGGPMSQSMSKFVAGSFRPEKSELVPPSSNFGTKYHEPNAPATGEPYICDLSTADA